MNKKKPLCFIVVLLVYWLVLYRELNKNTYKKKVIINIFFLAIKSFFYCNKKYFFIESKCFYRELESLWRAKKNIG
jgi:hypothetical protein